MQSAFRPDRRPDRRRTRGAAMVEMAVTLPLFLVFLLGLFEVARAMYLWSILANATAVAARGAATIDPADQAALATLTHAAGVPARAGGMNLGAGPNTDARLVITHLAADLAPVAALPGCPSQNIVNCTARPNGPECVRFVRAQLCAPGSGTVCERAIYTPLFSGKVRGLVLPYPTFATITPAASLGYQAGRTEVCPGP